MTLSEYITKHGSNPSKFAAATGIPQATIHRYVSGTRYPKPDMIEKIEKATKGAVTVLDWYKSRLAS